MKNIELETNKGFIEITDKGSVVRHLLPTAFFYEEFNQSVDEVLSWVKKYYQLDNDNFGVKIMKENNDIVFWTLARL
jgi:hypothetical protein|tara:strand:- start:98 stop:328 length:231 start_codon:yes stop_codon:yes gene_type:complete